MRLWSRYHTQGRLLDAIAEIHKTKLNWFAQETMEGFLLSMMVLARWYCELGLSLAGKYYALAAGSFAFSSSDPVIKAKAWRPFWEAAECDYLVGAWASFLDLGGLAVWCQYQFASDPGNLETHEDLKSILFHASIATAISERTSPELGSFVKRRVDQWGMGQIFEESLAMAREAVGQRTDAQLLADLEDQLSGIPINDAGTERSVSWAALGIEWSVHWLNDYETTMLAEQFVASFQVLLVEMARKDLCLPRTKASIDFTRQRISQPIVQPEPSVEELRWRIEWPDNGGLSDLDAMFLAIATVSITLLRGVSFLPDSRLLDSFDDLFKGRVPGSALVGRPYAMLYQDTILKQVFERGREAPMVPTTRARTSPVSPHPNLQGLAGPGPGYTAEKSQALIATRYEVMERSLHVTLHTLRANSDFRKSVQQLREEGWRDWHILHAIFSCALNFRAHERYGPQATPGQLAEFAEEFMAGPEAADASEIPSHELTPERLEFFRQVNMGAVLKAWGLDFHHPTLLPSVIEDFLAARYSYWEDDVEHPDLFGI